MSLGGIWLCNFPEGSQTTVPSSSGPMHGMMELKYNLNEVVEIVGWVIYI